MGLFDLFKNKKEPESVKKEAPASPEELAVHQRKSAFYKFTFKFLGEGVFANPKKVLEFLGTGEHFNFVQLLTAFEPLGKVTLSEADKHACGITLRILPDQRKCILLSFPRADENHGKLLPIPSPYFAAMIYHESDLSSMKYFVLTTGFDGTTNLRELNAKGMNMNCGNATEATLEKFFEAVSK